MYKYAKELVLMLGHKQKLVELIILICTPSSFTV